MNRKHLFTIALPTHLLAMAWITGCSSVGNVGKSAYIETNLVGIWRDALGRSFTYKADGSWWYAGRVSKWKVDYPYLVFSDNTGEVATFTIVAYSFDATPETFRVRTELGSEVTLTKSGE